MAKTEPSLQSLTRRQALGAALGFAGALAPLHPALAASPPGFDEWRDRFRTRAVGRGVSDQTYTRVMGKIEPDMRVFAQIRAQPEFSEQLWQYINRRVSDWRLAAGADALKQYSA